jgi:nucleotide-binding universal stress UspA family protein
MIRLLVAVDGSRNSLRAVRYVVRTIGRLQPVEVHLVNVQEPVDSLEVRRFMLPRDIGRMQRRRGADQLRAARALLDKARITYQAHALIGRVAETIVGFARRRRCDLIIMGTRGRSALANLLLGSVATKVIHLAQIPVTLVK